MCAYSRIVVVVQSVRSAVCAYSLGCCEIRVRVRNKVRVKIEGRKEKKREGKQREREREMRKAENKRKEPRRVLFCGLVVT